MDLQLRDQELFYEKLLARETVKALERSHNGSSSSSSSPRDDAAPNTSSKQTDGEFVTEEEMNSIEASKLEISGITSNNATVCIDIDIKSITITLNAILVSI